MKKICTDINQSRILRDLGVNQATADFGYIGNEGPFLRSSADIDDEMTPAWSLEALLSLLPPGTLFLSRYNRIMADFRGTAGHHDISLSTGASETYLDAVFQIVTAAVREKYI